MQVYWWKNKGSKKEINFPHHLISSPFDEEGAIIHSSLSYTLLGELLEEEKSEVIPRGSRVVVMGWSGPEKMATPTKTESQRG